MGLELETRGIQLCYANYVDKDVLVIADGEQIRRVIHNIISNAIKYMDKQNGMKGIIQIRVKDVGDFVQVEIEDNGKELNPKICRIFLTVSTGRMFHVIHPREEAESVFLSFVRFWRITVAKCGRPVGKESERSCTLF